MRGMDRGGGEAHVDGVKAARASPERCFGGGAARPLPRKKRGKMAVRLRAKKRERGRAKKEERGRLYRRGWSGRGGAPGRQGGVVCGDGSGAAEIWSRVVIQAQEWGAEEEQQGRAAVGPPGGE